MQLLKFHPFSKYFNFGADRDINEQAVRNLSTSFQATHYDYHFKEIRW
jgi:hypothetical protein